jgi:hypothetical protein
MGSIESNTTGPGGHAPGALRVAVSAASRGGPRETCDYIVTTTRCVNVRSGVR